MELFLYSTNCWLSYAIGQKYYKGKHFVWCSRRFGAVSNDASGRSAPPTSSPREIFNSLAREVSAGDRHSAKIASLKQGMLRGAMYRLTAGEISTKVHGEIQSLITHAETRDFAPLLYVISLSRVRRRLIEVAVDERAHPLSEEFKIERLGPRDFDVLELLSPP